MDVTLKKIDNYRWIIPKQDEMRTDGLIFADSEMIEDIKRDNAYKQVANVATLPGIVGKSIAMPDIHWGYGFPIGGVAAFDYDEGIISPGGIGYDINCGVRLLSTGLEKKNIINKMDELLAAVFKNIPAGVGEQGKIRLNKNETRHVLRKGAVWAVESGYGISEDIERIEEKGRLEQAVDSLVSERAIERGTPQLGTLGAGNHFLEIQVVNEIYDEETAKIFGLFKDQITVMIHSGSRGLGYQVCDDYLRVMHNASRKYNIYLPDRQLACAPVKSKEGQDYFSAMCAAANYAWANRQCITHWTRQSFETVLGIGPKDLNMQIVYDVCHNIGKKEEHIIDGVKKTLLVHRKGATRAFPKSRTEVPDIYKKAGQPIIVPGTMGSSSYVLLGTEQNMIETWGSTCHGAGRVMSRSQALKHKRGSEVQGELEHKGIHIKAKSYKTLAEEAPYAYKNVDKVVEVCHNAGISKKVAHLKPLAVMKG